MKSFRREYVHLYSTSIKSLKKNKLEEFEWEYVLYEEFEWEYVLYEEFEWEYVLYEKVEWGSV